MERSEGVSTTVSRAGALVRKGSGPSLSSAAARISSSFSVLRLLCLPGRLVSLPVKEEFTSASVSYKEVPDALYFELVLRREGSDAILDWIEGGSVTMGGKSSFCDLANCAFISETREVAGEPVFDALAG